MADPEDRLKQFETVLDPNVTKFAPKQSAPVPWAALIAQVREQTQATLKLCDEMDRAVTASENDARKAADILIAMAARIK